MNRVLAALFAVILVLSATVIVDAWMHTWACKDELLGARRAWVAPSRLRCPRGDQAAEPYLVDEQDLVVLCVCPDRQ